MKLVSLFDDFLKDTVNLNQTRIDLLEDSVRAIKDFTRQNEWKPKIRGFEEQGSWAHKTIIKPVDGGEFDADLLVMVDPVDGWTAADYVTSLGKVFTGSATYSDKAKTWDYCVTVNYASERKIDIAPCVTDRSWSGNLEVCNREKNQFERSEPVQYTDWLKERNTYSGSNSFRKVTRLLKYLRSIKLTFTCSSVLLTTLLGYRIEWFDKDTDGFVDAPAIVIPFGTTRAERHEIIPVHEIGGTPSGRKIYGMPNRVGGWMQASPDASGARINAADTKLNGKVKPLIRFAKAWKYYNNVPIRSFYLELRTVQFALTQTTILYRYDMRNFLDSLNANLPAIAEPETGNTVYVCYDHELIAVQTAIRTALGWANNARSEEDAGRTAQTFSSWDRVFAGQFPGYY